jgi:hypothetical protein
MAAIMFNIGALESLRGASLDRVTEELTRQAKEHFQVINQPNASTFIFNLFIYKLHY